MRKDKKQNNAVNLKAAAAHLRMLAVGVAMAGICGGLALTDNAFNHKKQDLQAAKSLAENADDQIKEPDISPVLHSAQLFGGSMRASELRIKNSKTEVKNLTFTKFKKAAIGEYDMTAVRIKTKTVENVSEEIIDPNDFTVPFPDDDTLIYEPEKRSPLNFTATRSVANEYFRVHDENSGSTLTMNGHELLCLMVNNEIGDTWDDDAIKAQIIAAYSHLRFNQSIGLTPTIGLRYGYSSKLENIVNSVEGQAMIYDGEIINAVYSASSAGYSTTAKDIWGIDYPYLKCVESEFDNQGPDWEVVKTYTRDEVRAMLENRFGIALSDDVTKWFTIDEVYSVKYVGKITIDGRSECTLTGNGLCNLVGLKSNALTISYKDGTFTFRSSGWGHGVGMSQWGAHYYAENGWTYDQILTHYYVGATLGLSEPSEYTVSEETNDTDDSTAETAETTAEAVTTTTTSEYYYYEEPETTEYTQWTEPVYTQAPETQPAQDYQWTDTTAAYDYTWQPDDTTAYTEYYTDYPAETTWQQETYWQPETEQQWGY